MEMNDKITDIEKCKADIIHFVQNILHVKLKPHEKLLLNKLIEAKKSGKDLVFLPYIPRTLHDKDIQCKYYGTNAKCVIFDEPDGK